MSQNHRLGARLAAVGAALALLAGCSSTPGPSPTTAPSQSPSTSSPPGTTTPSSPSTAPTAACAAADALGDALTGFKDSLEPGAAADDVHAARDQVVKAYTSFTATAGNAIKAHLDALKSAETRLDTAVQGISDDAAAAQALDSLKQDVNNVQAALSDVLTDISC